MDKSFFQLQSIQDISKGSWVIAVDFKNNKIKEFLSNNEGNFKTSKQQLEKEIKEEYFSILRRYGFNYRVQNYIAYNLDTDATLAYSAVILGLSKSWVRYFIERIHLFRVDPSSNAVSLFYPDEKIDAPEWLNNEFIDHLTKEKEENYWDD